MTHTMPDSLAETAVRIFGDAGRDWIERFPGILAQCTERWRLSLDGPPAGLSINYVAYATTDSGENVVLKVGVPHRELRTEIEALRLYDGRRMVRRLDSDLVLGAMLLDRLSPGWMLTKLGDNVQETIVAAGIMKSLPIPCPSGNGLPTFGEWIDRAFARLRRDYRADCGPLGRRLVEHAERAFQEIEDSKRTDVLLHGDLHHENILFDHRFGWTAIDPKGVIGDPCLEVGRFIQNQLPKTMPLAEKQRRIEERVGILSAELSESRERIRLCALVDKVLSLAWCLEDSYLPHGWDDEVAVAHMLSRIAG